MRLVTSRQGDVDRNVRAAAALVSVPWLGMYGATLFPGTALIDEEFADLPHGKVLGMEGNLMIATTCLALLAAGVGLARRSAN
jgi:hypothetical protein